MEILSTASNSDSVTAAVREVLPRIVKSRTTGELSPTEFEDQVRQISREQFHPRGLALEFKEMSASRIRFLIMALNGGILCHSVEYSA